MRLLTLMPHSLLVDDDVVADGVADVVAVVSDATSHFSDGQTQYNSHGRGESLDLNSIEQLQPQPESKSDVCEEGGGRLLTDS